MTIWRPVSTNRQAFHHGAGGDKSPSTTPAGLDSNAGGNEKRGSKCSDYCGDPPIIPLVNGIVQDILNLKNPANLCFNGLLKSLGLQICLIYKITSGLSMNFSKLCWKTWRKMDNHSNPFFNRFYLISPVETTRRFCTFYWEVSVPLFRIVDFRLESSLTVSVSWFLTSVSVLLTDQAISAALWQMRYYQTHPNLTETGG